MAKKRKPRRRQRPQPKSGNDWILVRQGFVQRVTTDLLGDGVMRKCWPIASTWEDANKLVDFFKVREQGVRPAQIGSAEHEGVRETLEGHIAMALQEGCEFLIKPVAWVDGMPKWGHIDMRE
jgi:hypothetical protein